jgi:hypothetical protein
VLYTSLPWASAPPGHGGGGGGLVGGGGRRQGGDHELQDTTGVKEHLVLGRWEGVRRPHPELAGGTASPTMPYRLLSDPTTSRPSLVMAGQLMTGDWVRKLAHRPPSTIFMIS